MSIPLLWRVFSGDIMWVIFSSLGFESKATFWNQIVYICWIAFEAVFLYFFLVETKNRTLEETAALFDGEEFIEQISGKATSQAGVLHASDHSQSDEKTSGSYNDTQDHRSGWSFPVALHVTIWSMIQISNGFETRLQFLSCTSCYIYYSQGKLVLDCPNVSLHLTPAKCCYTLEWLLQRKADCSRYGYVPSCSCTIWKPTHFSWYKARLWNSPGVIKN